MADTIPLNKLILSPRNVRKSNGDEDIESLADSIASKGLLQNLVVSETPGGKMFEVDAGGRRYRALMRLVERKALPRNWPVPVIVIPLDDAIEASLAENLQKVAMNPADEVEAFAAIVEGYGECDIGGIVDRADRIANCARRFGRTTRYVEQRLRLAALAPPILDALREGRITIECARAYAGHPDPKVQLKVFEGEEAKGDWGHKPNAVKDSLAGKVFPMDHKAVRYIGLDAYVEAGGRVESDLFFGDEEREVLLDPSLVTKLAQAKAAAEAQAFAQAEGWLDAAVAPVTGGSWSEPSPPKGFIKVWNQGDPGEDLRGDRIQGLRLKEDGTGLEPCPSVHFKPAEPISGDAPSATTIDWAARRREEAIQVRAARLALPKFAGTPFEGRAFYPRDDYYYSAFESDVDEDGHCAVGVMIKVPADQVEAMHAEAERLIDEEEAARAKAEAEAVENPEQTENHDSPETDDDETDEEELAA